MAIIARSCCRAWTATTLFSQASIVKQFARYAHTKINRIEKYQTVIFDPQLKRRLIEPSIEAGKQKEHVFDGLPIPGDKFYEASLRLLAEKIKKQK